MREKFEINGLAKGIFEVCNSTTSKLHTYLTYNTPFYLHIHIYVTGWEVSSNVHIYSEK